MLPCIDFRQMDVGLTGLILNNEHLSGILGETARPVFDENGREIMEAHGAFRGRALGIIAFRTRWAPILP